MWRNVYRLPDGSYQFGIWSYDRAGALWWRSRGALVLRGERCVGIVYEPKRVSP